MDGFKYFEPHISAFDPTGACIPFDIFCAKACVCMKDHEGRIVLCPPVSRVPPCWVHPSVRYLCINAVSYEIQDPEDPIHQDIPEFEATE